MREMLTEMQKYEKRGIYPVLYRIVFFRVLSGVPKNELGQPLPGSNTRKNEAEPASAPLSLASRNPVNCRTFPLRPKCSATIRFPFFFQSNAPPLLLEKSIRVTNRPAKSLGSTGKQLYEHAIFTRDIQRKHDTEIRGFAITESRIIVLMAEQHRGSVSFLRGSAVSFFEQHAPLSLVSDIREQPPGAPRPMRLPSRFPIRFPLLSAKYTRLFPRHRFPRPRTAGERTLASDEAARPKTVPDDRFGVPFQKPFPLHRKLPGDHRFALV